MRSGLMVAMLSLAVAGPAAAGQGAAARIYVQAAGAADGAADSAIDIKKELAAQKLNRPLALANSREEADLVLEVRERYTEDRKNYNLTPPADWIYSILTAALIDGDTVVPLKVETDAKIQSWTMAAGLLVTKDRKKQFGIKDGKVVVTAVAPGGPGDKAGLRAGDVITTVDGEKLNNPVKLARALYARGSNTTFALGVMQGGSTRMISLAVP